jgi:hypothetical protein
MDAATGTPVNLNHALPSRFTGEPDRVGLELAPKKLGAADWDNFEQADELIALPN